MTQEEKAKAYDEAKARMSKAFNSNRCTIGFMNEIFPELKLKEGEDEKMKNWILDELRLSYQRAAGDNDRCEELLKAITWLEKQGESDEIKAKTFLINKGYPIDANGTFPTYEEMYNIIREGLEKQGEQKNKISFTFEDVLALECSMKTAKITKGGDELYKILVPLYNKIHNAYLLEIQDKKKHLDATESIAKAVSDAHPTFDLNGFIECVLSKEKSPVESLGISPEKYEEIVNACIYDEEKTVDEVVPKFHKGDVMRTLQEAADNVNEGMPVVVSIDNEYYHCTNELIAIKDQDDYEYPPMNRKQKSQPYADEVELKSKVVMTQEEKELLLKDLKWIDMETKECHCYNCELFDRKNNVCKCIDLCKNPKRTYKGFYIK